MEPERDCPAERLPEYTRAVGGAAVRAGARGGDRLIITTTYLKFAGRRKPELLDTATYSLANYREAERVVAEYDTLRGRAQRRRRACCRRSTSDAFYELVLHPVKAAANLNELYVIAAKNRLYALQGRASTNDLADSARRDCSIGTPRSRRYYNTSSPAASGRT